MNNHLHEAKKIANPHYHGYSERTIRVGMLQASVAIAETLQEILDRMPEKSMQVIHTPAAPVEGVGDASHYRGVFETTFRCRHTHTDKLVVERQYQGDSLQFFCHEGDVRTNVILNNAEARRLAKTILAALAEEEGSV